MTLPPPTSSKVNIATASRRSNRSQQRTYLLWLLVGLGLSDAGTALATEYYVATTGNDSNSGTVDEPFATLQKGVNAAVAGDTVYIRGGTYQITTPANSGAGVSFSKSGTSDANRIKYWAYPGEHPVFDFSKMVLSASGYTHGFVVTGSWLHFRGLELCNVPMNTFSNNAVAVTSGGNDIFELLDMHHNSGNGLFIGSKSAGGHLVLNCDAHDNYDATSNQGQGQNADGFGVHYQTTGETTILRGCRAWWNSDDGYDLINQEVPVIVENSWAMGNGYADYGNTNPASGNGNGFKMGSSKNGVRHIVRKNVAWKNKASGFYANHSSGGNTWYNNTSYSNGVQYNMLASPPGDPNTTITLTGSLVHIMRNNLGFPNKNTNMTGVESQFNSWDLSITPASKDFVSTTDPSMTVKDVSAESSGALGPRQKDGSLPNVDFLRLAAGSAMIDKGTDVGLAFADAAPDLGAYEFGAAISTNSMDGVGGASTGRGGTNVGGKATSGGAASNGVKVVTGGTNSQVATGGAANDGGGTAASPHGTGTRGGNPGTTQDSSNSGGIATSGSEDVSVGGQVALGSAPNSGANGGNVGLGTSPARTGDGSTPQDADGCDCRIVDLPLHRSRFAGGILMTLLLLRRPRRVQRAAAGAAERGMPRAILQR